jgi:prepilin-type N-terminal cleavage/methylation domain-containing protein
MMHLTSRKGFTLIEILIVVTIIGLLASTVLVGLAPAQRRGRDTRRISDLKEIQNALELYYNKCGHYPGDSDCGAAPAATFAAVSNVLKGSSIGVSQIPDDPSSSKHYQFATNGTQYVLAATLEDTNNPVLKSPPALPDGVSLDGTCGTDNLYCVLF